MTKNSAGSPSHPGVKPATRFVTGGRDPPAFHGFVNPPVVHASTVLYPTVDDYLRAPRPLHLRPARHAHVRGVRRRAGRDRRAAMRGRRAAAVRACGRSRSRCSRCSQAGDHVLVTDNVYGPTRKFCDTVLSRSGVTTTYFDPLIGGGIAALMQPNTRAVYRRVAGLAHRSRCRTFPRSPRRRMRAAPSC